MENLDVTSLKRYLLIAVAVIVAIIAPLFVAVGGAGVIAGTAIGVGASLSTSPATCKAPPNIFDAWDTFQNFLTGVDCNGCETAGNAPGGVDQSREQHVKDIIGVARAMKIPDKGAVIALATALVESGIQNYANDGIYDTSRNPSDATLSDSAAILSFVKRSLEFPHDAVGSDASSVGIFQQQAWWGTINGSTWQTDPDNTIKRLMDPVFQAQKFYNVMIGINGWENMDPGTVAQRVQVSAFPDKYGQRIAEAEGLVAQYGGQATSVKLYDFGAEYNGGGNPSTPGASCGGGKGVPGLVLDKNTYYQITAQWGEYRYDQGPVRQHAGMDIDCGENFENVYTPLDGVVVLAINGNPSGSGSPAGEVRVKFEDGSIIRFYHMRNTFVQPGQQIPGGTAVGECANTGYSFGTHLHIEMDVSGSNNAAVQALPSAPLLSPSYRDPALVLDILGINICPPYVADRQGKAPGAPIQIFMKCWPPEEWVR